MFDFPSPASEGQFYAPSGGPQYVYTNGAWRMTGPADVSVSNIVYRILTSSGTYTKAAGLKFLEVTVVGGGGGATGGATTGAGASAAGGGGGGGCLCISFFAAADIPASVTYTVGAGGSTAPGAGGASTWDTMNAPGGFASGTTTATGTTFALAIPGGISGAVGGGNVLNAIGTPGEYGIRAAHGSAVSAYAGGGGGNPMSTPFNGTFVSSTGACVQGTVPGGGARGGANGPSQTAWAAAAGGTGRIYLKEYF